MHPHRHARRPTGGTRRAAALLVTIAALLACGPLPDPRLASAPVQHLEPVTPLPMDSPLRPAVLDALTRRADALGPARVTAAGTGWDVQLAATEDVADLASGSSLTFVAANPWSGTGPPVGGAVRCGDRLLVPVAAPTELGAHVVDAKVEPDPVAGDARVLLTLDATGAERIAALTRAALGKALVMSLDGTCLMAPTVMEEIRGGALAVSVGREGDAVGTATRLAARLDALLPVPLVLTELRQP